LWPESNSRARAERGRDIDNRLARRDQLLSQQCAVTGRALDRPHAWRERLCEPQQPRSLSTISLQRELAHELFVGVNDGGGV
jgi:hypothetical protein